jgi:hypothetical protein
MASTTGTRGRRSATRISSGRSLRRPCSACARTPPRGGGRGVGVDPDRPRSKEVLAGETPRGSRTPETLITISSHRRRRSPGIRRNLRSRYEAPILAPRAKQAPRRTAVRWYPTHGYQHDQPSQLRVPSLPMARLPIEDNAASTEGRRARANLTSSWPLTVEVISTPGVSCCRKRKRRRSGRCRQSSARLC